MGKATNAEVIKELKKIRRVLNRKYAIDHFFLFGSRARDEEKLDSDADLLVVSKKFNGIPFRKRPDPFLDAWKLPVDFEVLCYTPEELQRKQKELGLVREALKQAKEIK